jgi:hypothetical protein
VEGYDETTYGDRIAAVYDRWHSTQLQDTEGAVAFLAELAGEGPALELAIGTGRVALPLAARGIEVRGIDASDAMVAKLREKPGGAELPVTMGNFADVDVEGTFRLAYVVFNTFFALADEAEQGRCMANVASHLTDDGAFVIEAFVPDLTRFDRGQTVRANEVATDHVLLEAATLDEETQVVTAQDIMIREGEVRLFPVRVRYAFPEQLDAMAESAGMRLRERWSGWAGEPFTADSGKHVSVYEPA